MTKGYVLVRYDDNIVEPALICSDRYLTIGDEVMMEDFDGTARVVSAVEGYLHPEEAIAKIAELFEKEPGELYRIVGTVNREYWDEEKKDAE